MAGDMSADADVEWSTDEQRLLRHLLRNYDPAVRPVRNASSVVAVEIGLNLIQIVDMVCTMQMHSAGVRVRVGQGADVSEQRAHSIRCESESGSSLETSVL